MVVTMEASAVDEEIMNMMTICKRAACSTEEPPRMAPVIMPGMAIIPMTLGEEALVVSVSWVYAVRCELTSSD